MTTRKRKPGRPRKSPIRSVAISKHNYVRISKLARRLSADILYTEGTAREVSRRELVDICIEDFWDKLLKRLRSRGRKEKVFRILYNETFIRK